jgi:hypothetical protein
MVTAGFLSLLPYIFDAMRCFSLLIYLILLFRVPRALKFKREAVQTRPAVKARKHTFFSSKSDHERLQRDCSKNHFLFPAILVLNFDALSLKLKFKK